MCFDWFLRVGVECSSWVFMFNFEVRFSARWKFTSVFTPPRHILVTQCWLSVATNVERKVIPVFFPGFCLYHSTWWWQLTNVFEMACNHQPVDNVFIIFAFAIGIPYFHVSYSYRKSGTLNRIVGWLSAIEMEENRPGPSSSKAVGHYRLPHVWAILGPCRFSYKSLCTHKYMGFMFKYQLIEFTFISVSNPNCTPKYALCRCGCNWRVNAILPNPPCVREIFGS